MSDQISDGIIAKIIKVVIFNISAKFHAFFKIWTFIQSSRWIIILTAYMNSDIPLQTAAIFFLTNFYLKQGIG